MIEKQDLADLIRSGAGRGLDFVNLDELRKRTGIMPNEALNFSMREMACNSLDTDATEICIIIESDENFDYLIVRDNGSKRISIDDLKLILNFENKASSKRGFMIVSRGYLGNALKCIFGYSYALAESHRLPPPEIVVSSHGTEYGFTLHPNKIKDCIESDPQVTKIENDGCNTFRVAFPRLYNDSYHPRQTGQYNHLISAFSMVNPKRRISFDLWGMKGSLGESLGGEELRKETSIRWYTPEGFRDDLFNDYVRATPQTQLREFISLFRGFSRKPIVRDILHDLNAATNHDCPDSTHMQFVPATPISELSERDAEILYRVMSAKSKPISRRSLPQVLGIVGEERFEAVKNQNGWESLRYTCMVENENSTRNFPFILELAKFDRCASDEGGLEVYQCVNFMASADNLFSGMFDVSQRLGLVGISQNSHVTIVVHLISPVLQYLNYGKSNLYSQDAEKALEAAFDKLLPIPKTPRVYHPPPKPRPLSWIPSGKIGKESYEGRLRSFANEVLARNGAMSRPRKVSGRGWCYMLEDKITKDEFDKCEKAINDCRKIGFLPINFTAEDQDETRRFSGIHEASNPGSLLDNLQKEIKEVLDDLPAQTTDYWIGEKYYLMMCVEKGDLRNLFMPICEEYHIPIMSSKGWYTINPRAKIAELSIKAAALGLTPVLLLFYDHDPAGLKITRKWRKGLNDIIRSDLCSPVGWTPAKMVIERFGLNKEDIDKYQLTWIENIKTGSGKDAEDPDYIAKFGRRKVESNALFKNEETLKAAEEMCRNAIEKYYGKDALGRFREKEAKSKEKLGNIYDNPLWKNIDYSIEAVIKSLPKVDATPLEEKPPEAEKVLEVEIFRKFSEGGFYYGYCPKCNYGFNYDESDVGRLVRCRRC